MSVNEKEYETIVETLTLALEHVRENKDKFTGIVLITETEVEKDKVQGYNMTFRAAGMTYDLLRILTRGTADFVERMFGEEPSS